MVEGEGKCFSEGIYGYQLMGIPFQCKLFQIRNTEIRNLMPRDEGLLILIRTSNMNT